MVAVSTYASWFPISNTGSNTDSACTVNWYDLWADEACTTSWTDTAKVKLDTAYSSTAGVPSGTFYPLTVNRHVGFAPIYLWIRARTRGLVTNKRKIEVEVCGWETVTDVWGGQSRFEVYNLNSGISNQQKPYLYAPLFTIDSINCPITTYTLWTKNHATGVYSSYTGSDVTLDSGTGYLTISTANTHKTEIHVKAMS